MRYTIHATLDDALTDIAGRSFYENADVYRNDNGTYTVEDASGHIDETVMWTYYDGMELPDNALDYSRVHESHESYVTAGHVRYNLPAAVERLEAGQGVHFQYVVVESYPETAEDIADEEAGDYDGTVGWALIAFGF